MKSAQTSILTVNSLQAANSMTDAALFGITRALESMGRAFICLVSVRGLSVAVCIGIINSCAAACHNNKANLLGCGTTGGQGMKPSVSGTNAGT